MELIASKPFLAANPPRDPVRPSDAPVAVHHAPAPMEEALVADPRAALTPAEMVEHKLASLLKSQPLPVSHLMTARRTSRSH
jgi:hypothetical protein